MDNLMQKMQNLEKKIQAIETPAGVAVGGGVGSMPWWVDNLTPWLEFITLCGGCIVVILTIVLTVQRIIKNAKSGGDKK